MKQSIHPKYHADAKVACACGNVIHVGSTKQNIETELCSNCHPYFTGKEKMIDTAGRVEKFKTRATAVKAKTVKKARAKKNAKG